MCFVCRGSHNECWGKEIYFSKVVTFLLFLVIASPFKKKKKKIIFNILESQRGRLSSYFSRFGTPSNPIVPSAKKKKVTSW